MLTKQAKETDTQQQKGQGIRRIRVAFSALCEFHA